MTEHRILVCECNNLEHQVAIRYDKEENSLYLEPHLITHRTFIKRVWIGIKYMFGYRSRYGEFDEIILGPEAQKKIIETINNNKNA